MLTIPPHTSHKLQPLDRGDFCPFKTYFNDSCKSWFLSNPGKPLTIYNIASICGKAYPLAFTPPNILSGFKSSGVWPFNRNIFLDHEYSASLVSDRPNPESRTCVISPQTSTLINAEEMVDDPGFPPDHSSSMIVSPATGPTNIGLDVFAHGSSSSSDPIPYSFCITMVSTPSTSTGKPLTPKSVEEIRPFPKAERRNPAVKGRKPGRCRILTDTPEKK
ncbi:hypothetical protein J6590_108422 [Homalodisca vitripennis]|nr:hypothetical protein J6590_108422 [Homalodisca vitripennis]